MSFENRYLLLNEKQKLAVDTIYGPVLVIAGPGSGKTELLAVRIANILQKTDANASNILCLTFTDNAAKNMRDRLKKIIGQEAYKVAIHTFHTFGMEILNRYKYKLEEQEELNPIDDITQSTIFDSIIQELPWDHIWKKSSSIYTIKNGIDTLKKANITPNDFSNILQINEQILNIICPKIEESFEKIQSLGMKKEEKQQKLAIFGELAQEIFLLLKDFPSHYHTHELLGNTITKSMQEVLLSDDSKNLTTWRNHWLEKNYQGKYIPKDIGKLKKSLALLEIYEKYSKILKKESIIDFSDMILRAGKLLEDDTIRLNIAEQYQWILIDEYQDTNDAQLELVTKVADVSDFPNIFAVGDDDQSIYKFQGANTKNIEYFKEKYPETELIILDTNYRSNEEIINFSRTVLSDSHSIGNIFPNAKKEFFSHRGKGGHIEKLQFETELDEISTITDKIATIIQNEKNNPNFSLSNIAIISKKNATLELIGKTLLSKNIPVQLSKDENIFDNEVIILLKNILLYIHSLKNANDKDDLLIDILSHPIWNIHRLTLWEISRKIYNAKKEENKSWIESLRKNSDKNLSKIAHFFIELTLLSHTIRLEELIDIIIGSESIQINEDYNDSDSEREQIKFFFEDEEISFHSPIFEAFFGEIELKKNPLKYITYLANIRKTIDSLRTYKKQKTYLTLDDFIEYINLIEKYQIALTTSTLIGSPDAVQCITAHKSKGLEYDYVFAIGLTESNYAHGKNDSNPFPSNLSLVAEKDNSEDIERLIYTIFTRAKNELTLSYASKNLNEKTTSCVSVLGNISEWNKIEHLSNDNCSKILSIENKNLIDLPFTGDESQFLKNTISSHLSFSATAIQNFLNIIDGGPTYYLTRNIIQFPQAKSPNSIYGSAIHKALEDFFKDYKIKKTFRKQILFDSFSDYIQKEGLALETEKTFLERGQKNLENLYPKLTAREYGEIHLEHRFNLEGGGVFLENIRLTGAIDRIEIKDNKLIVTDYKTGSGFDDFESRNKSTYDAIKKWKYDLQLVFYALLFEESPRWKAWQQKEFQLFFVEEDKESGEFFTVQKFPQQGEIERLKKLIKIIAEHIENLNFPDTSHYSQDIKGIRQFEEDLLGGII